MEFEAIDIKRGVDVPVKANAQGNMLIAPSGGKYVDAALSGRLFYAANINMVTTSTTLHTTYVGLALGNPTGSGKLVIVHEFGYAFATAAAAGLILALAEGAIGTDMADDVNAPIKCTRNGYGDSVCYTDEGCTRVAPQIVKIITQHTTAATTTLTNDMQVVDLQGSIIIPPGRAVFVDTTTAAGASGAQFSFMWEEIDEV